ncbi:MAG: ABC transporter substrate-binding protein [Fimbriimonadales bacterium]
MGHNTALSPPLKEGPGVDDGMSPNSWCGADTPIWNGSISGSPLLLSALVALLLAGCGHPASSKSARNVFRVPVNVTFSSIDPALASETYSIDTMQNSFEGLVMMGEDNQIHPCLAESWDVSKDGKTYTFHLRHNVKFHDGKVLEAADVKKSIERSCGKGLSAAMALNYLNDIIGMNPFYSGKRAELPGVRLIDPNTISITLDAPRPYFLAKLTCPVASIVDCNAIKDGVHVTSVREMVGTGPFKFERYDEGQMIVQRAFDDYWGGRPKIDAIERPVMTDAYERLSAYKRGEIDMIPQLARSDYRAFLVDPGTKDEVQLIDRATLVYLALNAKEWPDRRVRSAIALAIDRGRIATDTMMGTVIPAKGILPPSIPGYRPNPAWPAPNPDEAKKVLSEAGHPAGKGLPELKIAFAIENPDIGRIADRIGAQIHDTLGIAVRLEGMDTGTLIARQNRKELQCVVTGWFADYIDPQDFLSMLLTTGAQENHWNYSNPLYDRFCAEADTCVDPARRLALYGQAEDVAHQDAVLIPVCYWKTPTVINRRMHGIRSYAGQYLPYNSVWVGE